MTFPGCVVRDEVVVVVEDRTEERGSAEVVS
jgi:hypothetical protein